tara:strand:+ start:1095 stop:1280 length:186 start_codon:yes stop_codon:yes gene_type:complete
MNNKKEQFPNMDTSVFEEQMIEIGVFTPVTEEPCVNTGPFGSKSKPCGCTICKAIPRREVD